MKVIIKNDYDQISILGARIISGVIKEKPNAVIGLATGSTPLGTYRELIRMHKEEGLDFSSVKTFNLDEYVGLSPGHDQSYRYFMNKNLFDSINIKPENTHVPDGMAGSIEDSCRNYEEMIKKAGGIDIQLLGIGSNGHIAFNEPGSPADSRTRMEKLTPSTIEDNSRFFKNSDEVPKSAITMGIGTILEAKKIILLASGENKSETVAKMIEGEVDINIPASALQGHNDVTVLVDKPAALKLAGSYE